MRRLIAWTQHARSTPVAGGYTYEVANASQTSPFSSVLRGLNSRNVGGERGYYAEIDEIRKRLVEQLTGQRARTSFRHEQVDMDVGECIDGVSSPETAARLIYTLVRMLKPARVVEIGSAFGVGTMYIAEALRMN